VSSHNPGKMGRMNFLSASLDIFFISTKVRTWQKKKADGRKMFRENFTLTNSASTVGYAAEAAPIVSSAKKTTGIPMLPNSRIVRRSARLAMRWWNLAQ
jgi:hypothetical protein